MSFFGLYVFMLSVITPNVRMVSANALSVVIMYKIMLSVIMPCVSMLSVVALKDVTL
jgi:hypothetical protein